MENSVLNNHSTKETKRRHLHHEAMKFQTLLPTAILVLSHLSAALSLPIGDTTAKPPSLPALLPAPPNPAAFPALLGGASAQGQAQGHLLKLRAQLQGQLQSGGDDGGLARAMGDMFARVLQQAAADGAALVRSGGGDGGLSQQQRGVAVGAAARDGSRCGVSATGTAAMPPVGESAVVQPELQQQQQETPRQIPASGEEGQEQQQQQSSREAAPVGAAAPGSSLPVASAQV
ncbi:hypothetical protein DFJ73DRAFT_941078 [Zopfochytrium polystomum]|nr:hypothetical protein DFJ73DRAFT_941078 [Zopfochytrium polystomum]